MPRCQIASLPERAILTVAGADARDFLQALVSNDIAKATAERAIYAALLTAQGKFLFDFLVLQQAERLLLDCEAARAVALARRLTLYKLRAKVTIEPLSDWGVHAAWGEDVFAACGLPAETGRAAPWQGGVVAVDPRLAALGVRLLLPRAVSPPALAAATPEDYDRHRLALAVPDGSRDIEVEKAILLESNFEELNGIDFKKGCYVGQEVTARSKYRGLVRKRLMRVDLDGPLPAPGTPIMLGESEAGMLHSGRDGMAIALLRLEHVEKAARSGEPLTAAGRPVRPVKPDWASF